MAENNNGDGGSAGGGTNNDGGAQNQGGDGKGTNGTGGGANSSTGTGQQQNQGGQGNQGGSGSGEHTFTQADVDRIVKDRLARDKQQHDAALATARDNATKPLQEQLDAVTKRLTDREAADAERNGKLALATVYSQLADAGVKKDDVKDVLEAFDPKRLLKDGELDDDAITKLAKSLAKVAGRIDADADQGRRGNGEKAESMGDVMRNMARSRR
jgi:hypothetical protein